MAYGSMTMEQLDAIVDNINNITIVIANAVNVIPFSLANFFIFILFLTNFTLLIIYNAKPILAYTI